MHDALKFQLLKDLGNGPLSNCQNITRPMLALYESKEGCKDQESIQSSTTPDPGYQWERKAIRNRECHVLKHHSLTEGRINTMHIAKHFTPI